MSNIGDWASVQYGAKAKSSRAASGGSSISVAGAAVGAAVAGASARVAVAPSCFSDALPGLSARLASTRAWWARVARALGAAELPIPTVKPTQSMTKQKVMAPMAARFRCSRGAYFRTRARALAAPLPSPDGIPPLTRWASLSASSIPVGTGSSAGNSRCGLQHRVRQLPLPANPTPPALQRSSPQALQPVSPQASATAATSFCRVSFASPKSMVVLGS